MRAFDNEWICTDRAHHLSIIGEFPHVAPHRVLRKWLYVDSHHDDFEATMERIAHAMARNDPRFGIQPRLRKGRTMSRSRGVTTARKPVQGR